VKKYDEFLEPPTQRAVKRSVFIGFFYGLSQFTQNAIFAFLFYIGAVLNYHSGVTNGLNVYETTFGMMFGAFAAG
jgi:hypothetical protein